MPPLLRGLALTLLCFSGTAVNVAAQVPAPVAQVPAPITQVPPSISHATGLLRLPPNARLERVTQARQPNEPPKRGWGRAVLGGAVGAVGGLFAGGYIGAKIEGNRCSCDDPGLTGALIGAPVGMVTGGVLGALYLF